MGLLLWMKLQIFNIRIKKKIQIYWNINFEPTNSKIMIINLILPVVVLVEQHLRTKTVDCGSMEMTDC